ncbi:subunit of ESCRT-II complex [Coccomyxa subellipsoidea C-169]|uniref:Subunit of ESCRT-II complex n=1 Tax=Coccomyxa subellipsoidea (strain C-169) TaxID=574566 RepID=I0YNU3_COCSC|nr:subunit of ESCRT-II complex [Coccomyxa subellipsoidea C-169]EIE20062.1 subunit of ESCRT-II complex [Coccomyxa subellipsoidea C-169]|eukprot:XP_005644606.1 subunit of ESCRT-II complex [Coccomyxa subellipsoidea C-169]
MTEFEFPFFFNYPPYFTLQPVKETRQKQIELWAELILRYCRHNKVYVLSTDTADDSPLFFNKRIERRLNREARLVFLNELTQRGNAQWLDKSQQRCLVLWKKLGEWADVLYSVIRQFGLQDTVMTLDELSSGDDVTGTELEGVPAALLTEVIRLLEAQGRAQMFSGDGDVGVKFS